VPPSPSEEENTLHRKSQLETRVTHEHDPLANEDTLESIESEYFSSEGFDPCGHELKVNILGCYRYMYVFRKVDFNGYLPVS
jgi:hypothetical protein